MKETPKNIKQPKTRQPKSKVDSVAPGLPLTVERKVFHLILGESICSESTPDSSLRLDVNQISYIWSFPRWLCQ